MRGSVRRKECLQRLLEDESAHCSVIPLSYNDIIQRLVINPISLDSLLHCGDLGHNKEKWMMDNVDLDQKDSK